MRAPFRQNPGRLALVAAAFSITALATGAGAATAGTSSPRHAGGGNVTVVGYSSAKALRSAAAHAGAVVVRRIPALHAAVLRTTPAAARVLEDLHGIRYSQRPVLRYRLSEPALAPALVPGGAYEWQYGAARVGLVPATVLQNASAITVAVIDSGADVTAPDLAAKNPATWSVVGSSTDVTDEAGHGTFVSSLAAGSSTNNEGIAGFGGDAKLLVVQAGGPDGSLTDVDEAAAIVYAVDHGARVINMSFGGPETSATEQTALNYAISHGALLVASAGNDGLSGNAVHYPAAALQPVGSNGQGGFGLTVAATDMSGVRASFSNYGSYISLAAPGEDVFGAISADSNPADWPAQPLPGSTSGLYGYSSGTSFSAPEVTGAAALVWAANPLLTAADVAAVLKQTAGGNGSWNPDTGYGVLDVAAAVARAQAIAVTPPTVTLTGTRAGTHVRLSWSAPGSVSYRLSVTRDGGAAQALLGATTDTSTSVDLAAGHSYSFSVAATTVYGSTFTSAPYVVRLPFSAVKLRIRSALVGGRKSRKVRLWTVFTPTDAAVARGGRSVALESYDGRRWRRLGRATTNGTGVATWTGKLRRGTYRVRARYTGAAELAAATSGAVRLRIR
jgi:subtilisin family serine protease